MIDTPVGPRDVEALQIGDLVTTLNHGPQPVRWIHSGDQPLEEAGVESKPVLIVAGARGRCLPLHDLIVSPQHRILVGGHQQLQGRFKTEVFAPEKALTKLQGIRHRNCKAKITWFHFACDRHEVVTANGCLSGSLLLGPIVVNGLIASERHVVLDLFGPAKTPNVALNGPPALECLKVATVRRQLARSSKKGGKLVANEIRKWDIDVAMERYDTELLFESYPKRQVGMNRVSA